MTAPRIGINCELQAGLRLLGDTRLVTLNPDYARCIARAGGIPFLLPPLAPDHCADRNQIEAQLEMLDGIVLVGGDDMDPAAFGEPPHPRLQPLDPERDAYDLALARAAIDRGIPILGVCGGMQLLAVVSGGALHQHLPDRAADLYPTMHRVHLDQHGESKSHRIHFEPDSILARIAGVATAETNSRHHQAVSRLGSWLRVVARSEDGVVEAIEATSATDGPRGRNKNDAPFVLGVQWHPEEHADDPLSRRIFEAFLAAAANRTRAPEIR